MGLVGMAKWDSVDERKVVVAVLVVEVVAGPAKGESLIYRVDRDSTPKGKRSNRGLEPVPWNFAFDLSLEVCMAELPFQSGPWKLALGPGPQNGALQEKNSTGDENHS